MDWNARKLSPRAWKRLLIGAGALALIAAALFAAAAIGARRLDPYLREQAQRYLRERFRSEVEIGALRVRVSPLEPLRRLFSGGRGGLATLSGENIRLRYHGRRDVPPMFTLRRFSATVDLSAAFDNPRIVNRVVLDGMDIVIPPKGERPDLGSDEKGGGAAVVVEEVLIHGASLTLMPRDAGKEPLRFELREIRLRSAGKDVAMKYQAVLTNAKPPGEIVSHGVFGPWADGDPGDTPLGGEYTFEKADLGVFRGIAGILRSTGTFRGTLDGIDVRGQADVPDFRLERAGNPIPLSTHFEARVDGTSGDTTLQPVAAVLGSTQFTTSGFIVKREGKQRRTIDLVADMPHGDMRDVLSLAMKGSPIMTGALELHTRIRIPPLSGKVKDKLMLEGDFDMTDGRFQRVKIQQKIDELSRRGLGKPDDDARSAVYRMTGSFNMSGGELRFTRLAFAVPGAAIRLDGSFDLNSEALNFHGDVRLDAKVSQTMSGWKRWVLKPLDPFLSNHGAGTFLHIKVEGTATDPQFGLDPGGK